MVRWNLKPIKYVTDRYEQSDTATQIQIHSHTLRYTVLKIWNFQRSLSDIFGEEKTK